MLFATVSALAIVGVSVAVAAGLTSDQTAPIYAHAPAAQNAVTVADPALADKLSVFTRTQTADDIPPSDIVPHDTLDRGANPQLARLAVRTAEQSVYVVPANGGACLVSSTFLAAGCYSSSDILAGNIIESVICSPYMDPDSLEVYGLLPDGTSNLTAQYSDGSQSSVALNDNAFVIDAPKSGPYPTKLEWSDGTTVHTVDSGLPPTAPDAKCEHQVTPSTAIADARAAVVAGKQ